MSFLSKRIEAQRERLQRRDLLEFLKTSGHDQLYEDFLDDMSADETTVDQPAVEPENDTEKKFQFFFGVNVSDPHDTLGVDATQKDVNALVQDIADKVKPERIARKLALWLRETKFLGDNPRVHVKLYTTSNLMKSTLNHVMYADLGNVDPFTPANMREVFCNCIRDNLTRKPEPDGSMLTMFQMTGLSLNVHIQYNPVRVTYKTLEREIANICSISDEIVMRFREYADVELSSLSYSDLEKSKSRDEEYKPVQLFKETSQQFMGCASFLVQKNEIWKFGQAMYSNGTDTVWDSENNENTIGKDMKTVWRGYQTVSPWMEDLMRQMDKSDVFTWHVDGQDEKTDKDGQAMITVLVENITERRKNTVRAVKEEFKKCLDKLSWKSKTSMRQNFYDSLNVMFIYKGSGDNPDRLPSGGKFEGNIEWDCNVKYYIFDDSPNYRQYSSKDKGQDPWTDAHYVRKDIVEKVRRYNPTQMKEKEDDYRLKQ